MGFPGQILFMAAPRVFRVDFCVWLCRGFSGSNSGNGTIGCTIVVTVVYFGFILVTVPNAFPDSLFINPFCIHALFERSTLRGWQNSSGTSYDGRVDKVARCWQLKKKKKRKIQRQQLTVIYCSMFRLHHHHHHIALVARISLTLSRHSSLSFIALGRSSGQHPVSSHSCWM